MAPDSTDDKRVDSHPATRTTASRALHVFRSTNGFGYGKLQSMGLANCKCKRRIGEEEAITFGRPYWADAACMHSLPVHVHLSKHDTSVKWRETHPASNLVTMFTTSNLHDKYAPATQWLPRFHSPLPLCVPTRRAALLPLPACFRADRLGYVIRILSAIYCGTKFGRHRHE